MRGEKVSGSGEVRTGLQHFEVSLDSVSSPFCQSTKAGTGCGEILQMETL